MEFLFFNAAGTTLFSRNDAESGNWTVEEMTLQALFPFDAGKNIQRGMRIGFADAEGNAQVFEIRKVRTYEPDHYQEITAEHIAISELTDEHTGSADFENVTAGAALTTLLTGTLWQVGTNTASNTSTGSVTMGSVWQAMQVIRGNWNVYLTPRITTNGSGITGRYIDIRPAGGIWNGMRLSLDKNADEIGVTWDDTKVKTALYGYGGLVEVQGSDDRVPLTFTDTVWTATADHPAKPANQAYIEDPDAKAAYGRNGRNRFGFYQNGDIDDPEILLEKTWEVLKTVNVPDVSIDCMVRDLYRLGYADEPLRLHDTAIIEIRQTGVSLQKEIIKLAVDLLNPTATRVTIGAYIPNIVYINKQTNDEATGGGGGSGTKSQGAMPPKQFETFLEYNDLLISLKAVQYKSAGSAEILRQAGMELDAQGVLVYATDNANMLQSKLNVQADQISLVVEGTGANAHIKAAQITAAINGQTGQSIIKLSANVIDVDGLLQTQAFQTAFANIDTLVGNLDVYGAVSIGGALTVDQIIADGYTFIPKTKTVVTEVTVGAAHDYVYHDQYGQEQLANGKLVTAVTTDTISYLGEQVSS